MHTAVFAVAQVGRAGVVVIAVEGHSALAASRGAGFPQGAGVAVIAESPVVGGFEGAFPGHRIAGCNQALCSQAFGGLTSHDRFGYYGAFLRELLDIAVECAVADVHVLEQSAVRILLAVARNREAGAGPVETRVVHRAGIDIIAWGVVERVDAAAGRVTLVRSTDVVVVAVDGRTHAFRVLAMVCQRADIIVAAIGTGKRLMRASHGGVTFVHGTLIAIVA